MGLRVTVYRARARASWPAEAGGCCASHPEERQTAHQTVYILRRADTLLETARTGSCTRKRGQ